jgi:CheY-like chemotaxis protein
MERIRTPATILLVEDYADSRQMLKLLLEDLEYRLLTAATGEHALTIAAKNHIDLVLTDFNLPDFSGATMVLRLRKLNEQLKSVPVVVITASDAHEHRQLAHEADCNAFLLKPLNFEMLTTTIDELLQEANLKNIQMRSSNTSMKRSAINQIFCEAEQM